MADYSDLVNTLWPFQQTQESGNNPNAVSPKGAFSLAQMMPATAANPGFGVAPYNPNVPGDDVRFGKAYDAAMLNRYQGNPTAALAAYNWGPGNVDRWVKQGANTALLPAETRAYVANILAHSAPNEATKTNMVPSGILSNTPTTTADGTTQQTQNPSLGGLLGGGIGPMLMALGSGIASGGAPGGGGWGGGIGRGLQGMTGLQQTMLGNQFKLAEIMNNLRHQNVMENIGLANSQRESETVARGQSGALALLAQTAPKFENASSLLTGSGNYSAGGQMLNVGKTGDAVDTIKQMVNGAYRLMGQEPKPEDYSQYIPQVYDKDPEVISNKLNSARQLVANAYAFASAGKDAAWHKQYDPIFQKFTTPVQTQPQTQAGATTAATGGSVNASAAPSIPQVKSAEDYAKLPPGPYLDPNGKMRIKRVQ